jgi:choline kinase
MREHSGGPAQRLFTGYRRPASTVILAAGNARRLQAITGGGSKLLIKVRGITLIERTVGMALRMGMERIVVITGYDAERVGAAARRADPGRVLVVHAENWESGNGSSLAAAEAALAAEPLFLLTTGDHLIAEQALRMLLDSREPAALLDPNPSPEVLAEGTRAVLEEERVVAFGKDRLSSVVDCGAFLVPPSLFTCQREAAASGRYALADALTRLAAREPLRAVMVPEDAWWQDVDIPSDLTQARRRLRR